MTCGPHLHRPKTLLAEQLAKVLGVVPPRPEAQHAQDMAESLPGCRAEVDGYKAPTRLEYTADLREPPTLQSIGQMVEHQAAQHHVEAVIRVRKRLDRPDLEAHLHACSLRIPASQVDHLGRRVYPASLARWPCDSPGKDGEPTRSASHVEDPLARRDGGKLNHLSPKGRHPP